MVAVCSSTVMRSIVKSEVLVGDSCLGNLTSALCVSVSRRRSICIAKCCKANHIPAKFALNWVDARGDLVTVLAIHMFETKCHGFTYSASPHIAIDRR